MPRKMHTRREKNIFEYFQLNANVPTLMFVWNYFLLYETNQLYNRQGAACLQRFFIFCTARDWTVSTCNASSQHAVYARSATALISVLATTANPLTGRGLSSSAADLVPLRWYRRSIISYMLYYAHIRHCCDVFQRRIYITNRQFT